MPIALERTFGRYAAKRPLAPGLPRLTRYAHTVLYICRWRLFWRAAARAARANRVIGA